MGKKNPMNNPEFRRASERGDGDWFVSRVDPMIWLHAAKIILEKCPISQAQLWCDELKGSYNIRTALYHALHLTPRMLPEPLLRLGVSLDKDGRYIIEF